jgi:hypothetical protein
VIHLIDWGAEPDSVDSKGKAIPAALPDFVVLVNPNPNRTIVTRSEPETFSESES